MKWMPEEARVPLTANKAQYRKHRDLRMALLAASRDFDIKSRATRAALEGNSWDLLLKVPGGS